MTDLFTDAHPERWASGKQPRAIEMQQVKEMDAEGLKLELEVIKDRFRSLESDWVFQDRCGVYQTDENKLLALLNARINQIRCRLKYTFNWLDPDNRAGNWMI